MTRVSSLAGFRRRRRERAAGDLRDTSAAELMARHAELLAVARKAGLTFAEISGILNSRPDNPRPLLPEERDALTAILGHADFEGRDALVVQAATAKVDSYCGCGCATVGLVVDRAAPAASGAHSPIPNWADVVDERGESIGGIIVFLDEGFLSSLEIYSYYDPISPIPPVNRLLATNR